MNERCTLGLWQRKLCALTLSAMNKIYSIKLFIVFHFWDRKNKVIVAMRTKIQCTKFHHAIGILQQIFHCKVDAVASCSTDFDVGVLSQKCTLKSSPEHSAAHVARNLRQNHQHRTATIFTGPLNANQRRIMEIFPELKICNSYTKVFCVLFVLFFCSYGNRMLKRTTNVQFNQSIRRMTLCTHFSQKKTNDFSYEKSTNQTNVEKSRQFSVYDYFCRLQKHTRV